MEEIYDPISALKAFQLIKKTYTDATLVMAGNGRMLRGLSALVEKWDLAGVVMTGGLCAAGIASILEEACIYLNTSLHDGLPTSLLEAAAMGVPIVTTAVGGIISTFKHETEAVLVPPGDPESMANAVTMLLRDPDRSREMAGAARCVAEQYDWSRTSGTLAALYGFAHCACVHDAEFAQ